MMLSHGPAGTGRNETLGVRGAAARIVFGRLVLSAVIGAAALADTRPPVLLQAVNWMERAGQAEVTFRFDHPVRYKMEALKNPNRVYVDLLETYTKLGFAPGVSKGNVLIERIRMGAPQKDTTRIVLDLREPLDYSIVQTEDPPQLVIALHPRKRTPPESAAAARVKPAEIPSLSAGTLAETSGAAAANSSATADITEVVSENDSGTPQGVPNASAPQPATTPQPLAPQVRESVAKNSRKLTIPKALHAPQLDQFLSGAPLDGGLRVDDFRQREPGDGTPVSLPTAAYISFDAANLYVVFVCQDEPGKVRGRMSKREDISDDDNVTVFLDTFHDGQHAYYFSANPLGVQADGILTASGRDGRFDTIWNSDGRITQNGYVVLFAIPFKSLRFTGSAGQTWGIALQRSIPRSGESSFWPVITLRQQGFIQQMGIAEGLSEMSSTKIQLIPYGAFTGARLLNPSGPNYQSQTELRGGLDAKAVLHKSLTLDLTLNPDFSQVESDDPQVTVNNRYEVVFPEKRPFFFENIGYFTTPINLVFTRRIIDPEFGARLTGKLGRWNIGVLGIDDRAPGVRAGATNSLYGDHAVIGAVRIQREFLKDSSIGILLTDRRFGQSESRMFSVDTSLRLSPSWFFTGQAASSRDQSYTSTYNIVKAKGPAYFGDLSYSDRNFNYDVNYRDFSKDFRAPLGYVQRVDIRTASQSAGYSFRPENSKILSFGPSVSMGMNWDHSGRLQDKFTNVDFRMDFAGPVGFDVARYDAYEYYLGQGLRYGTTTATFYANWIKPFNFYGSVGIGQGVNYSPADGVQPYLGKTQNASFGFTWRPTTRLRWEEFYYFTRLGAPTEVAGSTGGDPTTFANHLMRAKVNYQFTRALSLRGIVDYNFLLPNAALFNSDRYKTLTGDVLLTYLLKPGTALYVGYNNSYENLAIDPETPLNLRRFGPPSYLTGRQIFIKLSYLLRF